MTNDTKQSHFSKVLSVGLTCIFTGGFIGAITNMVNGSVSPAYFRIVMGWDFTNIWIASVAQGLLEGLIYGVLFSLIFTSGFVLITKGKASYNFALKQLFKIILITLVCWAIGGVLGLLLASLSPDFFRSHFYHVPKEKIEMIKYAWVGGSIWGGMLGGLLSAVFGLALIKINWKEAI